MVVGLLCGFAGAVTLALSSYALETPLRFQAEDEADRVENRNKRRVFSQRVGLGLIAIGFLLQLIATV